MAEAEYYTPGPKAQEEYWDCVCMLLPKGEHTIIDLNFHEEYRRYNWLVTWKKRGTRYVFRNHYVDGRNKLVSLHKQIYGDVGGLKIDHRNGDSLDNRRSNLRRCTQQQNVQNRRKTRNATSSRFKGVARKSSGYGWQVYIEANGVKQYLGSFKCEVQAAMAYNDAAKSAHGEFACLNQIPG